MLSLEQTETLLQKAAGMDPSWCFQTILWIGVGQTDGCRALRGEQKHCKSKKPSESNHWIQWFRDGGPGQSWGDREGLGMEQLARCNHSEKGKQKMQSFRKRKREEGVGASGAPSSPSADLPSGGQCPFEALESNHSFSDVRKHQGVTNPSAVSIFCHPSFSCGPEHPTSTDPRGRPTRCSRRPFSVKSSVGIPCREPWLHGPLLPCMHSPAAP